LDQYFAPGPEETVILIVSLLWLFSEIVGARIIPRLRGGGTVKARGDRGSRLIIWLSIFVSIAIAAFFGTNGVTALPEAFFYLGIVLMLDGIAFRQ
jgi:hypothetical protein